MQVLDKNLRNQLERNIKKARDITEEATRSALEQLGVGETAPYSHLNESDRDLRRRLRAHGRQLGDRRQPNGEQATDRLNEKVAYEHWHRMLFARFLAENNLLMYPDLDEPVAITLEECEDLSADEAAANGWELAARFAARMLPQIFRPDSPVFQLILPPEHQLKLERLVTQLPLDIFLASDSLGWVYQFWQAKKKDEVNASEVKIGARELPAVTQLFTEPYMVNFLLDNSLGAWWAARRLTKTELQTASSENELRQKASIPGVPLEYLRLVQQDDGSWIPAAGTFNSWSDQLAELKVLDPCCGSGHFLVAAFLMLVPMRMESDDFSAKDAVDAVLRENIHGLEIDQRCVELAAFALALAAWKYPDAGGYRILPELNVACSGLSISAAKEEWKQLAMHKSNLRLPMNRLYEVFKEAPLLGSLLDSAKSDAIKPVEWEQLSNALEQVLNQEQSEGQQEAAVAAQGMAKAATLISRNYQLVITNVPYLGTLKQNERLRAFCERHYSAAKRDLATVFLNRCLELCTDGGTASVVLPQNWLFLTSYKSFREQLLKAHTWHLIARLGPGAFETISGEVVKAILISVSRGNSMKSSGIDNADDGNLIRGLDVSEPRTVAEKCAQLRTTEVKSVEQAAQLENPDARVVLESSGNVASLERIASGIQGIATADYPRFGRCFWEMDSIDGINWIFQQSTVKETCHFGGKVNVLYWEGGNGGIATSQSARVQGLEAWQKLGIAAAQMRQNPVTLHTASSFDNNTAVIILNDDSLLSATWCFCSSPEYNKAVRRIDQSLSVTNATLVKVPFDLDYWTKIAEVEYPNGLPKPYANDPTQWIFHGHPCGSVDWDDEQKWTINGPLRIDNTVLQVAVARLLGYRWPAELDASMELADEQRDWVHQCENLVRYTDDDGIVCIPPVRGEASASDRLLDLLVAAYGDRWSNDTLGGLLSCVDHADKTLETWLREKFFVQHCRLFQHRPFIWHIWDGQRDGFAALVNYHKFDVKLLKTLIYTYLGDWINRQKQGIASGVDGSQERLAAAESLKKKLELILEGESPYDIFTRWKPLEQQSIGWNPDLNDGVRLNIRPFMTVPDVGRKGAGILRDKPNIKWNKDRGKDVESAPWHHVFSGDRINGHHLTLTEKLSSQTKLE